MITKFIQDNLFSIVSILALGGWLLFGYVMDSRHDAKGTAAEAARALEIENIRRQIREKNAYQKIDPRSKYAPARAMLIDELEDDLAKLEAKE